MKTTTLLVFCFLYCLFDKASAQFAYTRDIKDSAESFHMYNLQLTEEDNSIIATTTPDLAAYGGVYLSKFNYRGKLAWSKNYSFFSPYTFFGLKSMATENDGFVAIAAVLKFNGYGAIVFKADSNGNPIWIKWLKPALKKYNVIPLGGVYANDKSIYIVSIIVDSGLLIQKLDKNGEPLWNRYLFTDSIPKVETKFVFATVTTNNDLIISTRTFYILENKNYNHFYKISKDGNPEWAYEIKQDSANIYGIAAQCSKDDKLNILYSRNYKYAYSNLDPLTGQSKTYQIGETVYDLQYYLRKNNISIFNGVSFPFVDGEDFNIYAFTKNRSLAQASRYQIGLIKYIPRIQLSDSLGRICPDFKLPKLDTNKTELKLRYIKSSYHFSSPPVSFSVIDTIIGIQNFNVITNVCAGKSPDFSRAVVAKNSINKEVYNLNIFPNPVKDKLNMIIDVPSTGVSTIDIINIDDKILKSESMLLPKGTSSKAMNMDDILQGIYIVRVSSSLGLITQKIIKQ